MLNLAPADDRPQLVGNAQAKLSHAITALEMLVGSGHGEIARLCIGIVCRKSPRMPEGVTIC